MTRHSSWSDLPDRSKPDHAPIPEQYDGMNNMILNRRQHHVNECFVSDTNEVDTGMYHFGNSDYANCQPCPQALAAEYQFTVDLSTQYIEQDNNDLLTSWMSDEIAATSDMIDTSSYLIQDEFFDNLATGYQHYGQPQDDSYRNQGLSNPGVFSAFNHPTHFTNVSGQQFEPPSTRFDPSEQLDKPRKSSSGQYRPIKPRNEAYVRIEAPPDTTHVDESNVRGRK